MKFDLTAYIHRQIIFSRHTFGPGTRLKGVLNHLLKEVEEIKKSPQDISEWCDLIILAIDGATRQGFSPEMIVTALESKYIKNSNRKWPDWRTLSEDDAIEHIRERKS